MTTTAAIIHVLILVGILLAMVGGRRHALWMAGFVAPLQGLRVELGGVGWQWARLLPLLLLLAYVIYPPNTKRAKFPGSGALAGLLLWTLAASLFFFFFHEPTELLISEAQRIGWGPAQTTYRHPVQFVVFLSYFGSAFLITKLVTTQSDLHGLLAGFVAGNLASIAVGAYQLVAMRTGLPLLEFIHESALLDQVANEARLFGLGGEPKHTGASAVLALAVLFSIQLAGHAKAAPTWQVLMLMVGVLVTLSTSAFVGLALLLSAVLFLSLRRNEGVAIRNYLVVGIFVAVGLAVFASGEVARVVEQRIGGRLLEGSDTISSFEPKDDAFVQQVSDSPVYLLTGHGAGGADFHLIEHFRPDMLARSTSITPTYTINRMLADNGAIGLVFLLLMLRQWWFRARAHIRPSVGDTFLLTGGIAIIAAPYVVFILYLLIGGAFVGYYSCLPQDPNPSAEQP